MLCCGNVVALVNVLCARNYLHGLALANVYLTNEHMVAVGVRNDVNNVTHHNVREVVAFLGVALDLAAREGHRVAECFYIALAVNIVRKPSH